MSVAERKELELGRDEYQAVLDSMKRLSSVRVRAADAQPFEQFVVRTG